MIINKRIRQLTEEIYDAALDPAQWAVFLETLADTLDASTSIGVHFPADGATDIASCARLDPSEMVRYHRYYSSLNPWIRPGNPVYERWVASQQPGYADEIVDLSELRKTEFYNDWSRRNGVVHPMGLTLLSGDAGICFLTANRSEQKGFHPVENYEILSELTPHLRKAITIHRRMAEGKQKLEICHGLSTATFQLSGDGAILALSRTAEEMLALRDGIHRQSDGRLSLRGIAQDREFKKRLRQIVTGNSTDTVMRVKRISGHASYLLVMRALDSESRLIPRKDRCAVVLIVDPGQRMDAAVSNATRFYGFTKAEAELVRALLQDQTLVQSAQHLRISINTAKTHLRSIFYKTGVSRQAELVRALLAVP